MMGHSEFNARSSTALANSLSNPSAPSIGVPISPHP
jgi:hypothetical protein